LAGQQYFEIDQVLLERMTQESRIQLDSECLVCGTVILSEKDGDFTATSLTISRDLY